MNLSQQVTSLELSKKLKELGVPQESLFVWFIQEPPYKSFPTDNVKDEYRGKYPSAYTVAELGELLPTHVQTYRTSEWWCTYKARGDAPAPHQLEYIKYDAETEADARALMLIYLLQNKLITL